MEIKLHTNIKKVVQNLERKVFIDSSSIYYAILKAVVKISEEYFSVMYLLAFEFSIKLLNFWIIF